MHEGLYKYRRRISIGQVITAHFIAFGSKFLDEAMAESIVKMIWRGEVGAEWSL